MKHSTFYILKQSGAYLKEGYEDTCITHDGSIINYCCDKYSDHCWVITEKSTGFSLGSVSHKKEVKDFVENISEEVLKMLNNDDRCAHAKQYIKEAYESGEEHYKGDIWIWSIKFL